MKEQYWYLLAQNTIQYKRKWQYIRSCHLQKMYTFYCFFFHFLIFLVFFLLFNLKSKNVQLNTWSLLFVRYQWHTMQCNVHSKEVQEIYSKYRFYRFVMPTLECIHCLEKKLFLAVDLTKLSQFTDNINVKIPLLTSKNTGINVI